MRLVILESPYAGRVLLNTYYARCAVLDALRMGDAPIASHLLYTQVLDDLIPWHRELGISAGLAWLKVAEAMVVYTDLGTSRGMIAAIEAAKSISLPIEYRQISSGEISW